ncbi:hypothetical protein OHC33_001169 [Knufia fluminis]|uniref:Capsule synthesis protein CapA domain-containing protein n=1 Tax=Knufia fluminis TaxID=191047 RepID=A0AAN8I8V7_9EURO|nr:hypothetical protein OHC33_001169 [Knufia fluminis]
MAPNAYTLTFLGDLMLGRLIDQLLPEHVHEPKESRHVANMRRIQPDLQNYNNLAPWGNTVDFLKKSDLVLGNLETAATNHPERWPNKVFNYRMHPANVECLKLAGIDYVSLANNHTLDFGREGLLETVRVIEEAGIAHAGAGRSVAEAEKPAVLKLERIPASAKDGPLKHEIHLYSFSDHPSDWVSVPEFNLLRYDPESRAKLKGLLTKEHAGLEARPALKIVSVHWGPNYRWEPDDDITTMARFLVDECGVDIIHGHSSHHVQGVEVYKGELIIYGCGDFVDDYAVNAQYRNDLSAAWNVSIIDSSDGRLRPSRLEVFPTRIKSFQAGLLSKEDADHGFVCDRIRTLSADLGTTVESSLGDEGQLIVDIQKQSL